MIEILRNPKFLPTIMIVLCLGAALANGAARDWRKTIYWLAAAALNASVTY